MSISRLSPIIQAAELLELYKSENIDLVIIDASGDPLAQSNYQARHLDKALFVDLNTQLADIKADYADGGRHPLPTFTQFTETLKSLGISPKSHVVIYDDKNGGNAAARFWWMLRAIAHEKVQVLNGGLQEAAKKGLPINNYVEYPKEVAHYKVKAWNLPLASIDEIEANVQKDNYIVIDVRESSRYNGEQEPIDLVAGHIAGAINIPYFSNLTSEGLFLNPVELKQKYEQVLGDTKSENVAVHCGSGVTACHTLLAMDYAGLKIPKLYVGSWSEWSRNKL